MFVDWLKLRNGTLVSFYTFTLVIQWWLLEHYVERESEASLGTAERNAVIVRSGVGMFELLVY